MAQELYTVVNFLDGTDDTSEVPSTWLEGDNKCWWPPSKNVGALIAKRIEPNKETWKLYDIQIEYKCDDLKKARHKAHNLDYSTHDESKETGRGKRKKILKTRVLPNDSEELSTSDEEKGRLQEALKSLPEYPNEDPEQEKGDTILPDVLVLPVVTDGKTPDQFTNEEESLELDTNEANYTTDISRSIPEGQAIGNVEIEYLNVSTDKLVADFKIYMTEQFSKLHRSIARLQLTMNSMGTASENDKVIVNEGREEESLVLIKALIPVQNIDDFKIFEERLGSEENLRTALFKYYQTLGGNSLKEKVVRIFKRTITNKVAAKASWYGQRQNFKMENTKTVSIIKDVLAKESDFNEKQFEENASDWIRQGKQRLAREEK